MKTELHQKGHNTLLFFVTFVFFVPSW